MEYFLYLIGGVIVLSSIAQILQPKESRKIVYNLIYFIPLWSWGIILLALSALVWHSKTISSLPFLTYLIFALLFIKGLVILFLPKRKMKKVLERFLISDEKSIRVLAIVSLIIGLLILWSVWQ